MVQEPSNSRKIRMTTCRASQRAIKTMCDSAVAGVALVVLAPIMACTAVVVGATMGRPVLFSQLRPGLNARPFTLYKFRTMSDARDETGRLKSDAERLTRIGQWLRATSLDELPQLWNVLRGDMSLVGPRPLLMQYLDRYTPEQARRHEVKPGITGWAQVNGRAELGFEDRFRLDVWYVDHWSLWLDMRVLCLTVARVISGSGIAREGHATGPEFMGTKSVDPSDESRS